MRKPDLACAPTFADTWRTVTFISERQMLRNVILSYNTFCASYVTLTHLPKAVLIP